MNLDFHLLKPLMPLIPFGLGILFKTMLDFNVAWWIVKYFHWVPIRWMFRTKPHKISGTWKQLWNNATSVKYTQETGRVSNLKLKQFGKYLYGEYRVRNDEEYRLFGEIIGANIVGKWSDKRNELGYYGAFEMRIIDANKINGRWLGHSNSQPGLINSDSWEWSR